MATVTANPAIATYGRSTVARGGSISALWFEGYGPHGFLQVSSQTVYDRTEPLHMPIEGALLPLTARIETPTGAYATNLYDDRAAVSAKTTPDGAPATPTRTLPHGGGAATPAT